MTRQMSKTTVKKPARIMRQNAQLRARPDFRPAPEGARYGATRRIGPLPAFQAERMTGRVGVDPEPRLGAGQPGRPQRKHLRLRGRDVVNVDVQVDLLGKRRVRPARRPVAGCVLEAQAGLAVTDVDPLTVDPGDRQPEQLRVEMRQAVRIAAIEHHRGKPAGHRALLPEAPGCFGRPANVTIVCRMPHSGYFLQLAREIPAGILPPQPGSRRARPPWLGSRRASAPSPPLVYRGWPARARRRARTCRPATATPPPRPGRPRWRSRTRWPARWRTVPRSA